MQKVMYKLKFNIVHGDAFERKKSSEVYLELCSVLFFSSVSKGVNVFQNTTFKDVRILGWNEGGKQNGVVTCI